MSSCVLHCIPKYTWSRFTPRHIRPIEESITSSQALPYITLLSRGHQLPPPPCEDTKSLADNFNESFIMKIDNLQLTAPEHTYNTYIETAFITSCRFSYFQCITPDDILKIIQKCPPKSCELDPLPSTLIKQHADSGTYYMSHPQHLTASGGLH